MLKKEIFINIINTLKGAYTQFNLTENGMKVWYSKIGSYTEKEITVAIDSYIENEEWEPRSPRSITKYIDKQKKSELSEVEAYILVVDAIKKYGRDGFKEAKAYLDSKDKDIWLAIKNTRSNGWQSACSEREQTYEKAYKQAYVAIKKRKAENKYINTVPNNALEQSKTAQLETTLKPVKAKTTKTDKEREKEAMYERIHSENPFNLKTYNRKPVPRTDTPKQEEVQNIVDMFVRCFPKCVITERDYTVINDRLQDGYTFEEFEYVANYKAKQKEVININVEKTPRDLYDKEWFGTYLNQWFMEKENLVNMFSNNIGGVNHGE